MLFWYHDPRGLSAVNVGSDRRIWVWAAKLTKLMIVLSHWLVEFMRSLTSATPIHFTDQKVAGGACATYQHTMVPAIEKFDRMDVWEHQCGSSGWWDHVCQLVAPNYDQR